MFGILNTNFLSVADTCLELIFSYLDVCNSNVSHFVVSCHSCIQHKWLVNEFLTANYFYSVQSDYAVNCV